MYQGLSTIIIDRPLEKVYSKACTYPTFVRFFLNKSKIIYSDPKKIEVEVHARLFGFWRTKWQGEGIKSLNKSIDFLQTEGMFKNLKASWMFEPMNVSTKVSIQTTFSKPLFERFLGEKLVERTTQRILQELKTACESGGGGLL